VYDVCSESNGQEAQLPQTDRVTRYVSKYVLRFTSCKSFKGFNKQK